MTSNLRFSKNLHLRSPQDFERVYDGGHRSGDAHLLVFALKNELPHSRIGLSISKKHGGAVQRNLKRRRLREAFRQQQHKLPSGVDFIFIPRQRDDSTLGDFQKSMAALTARLVRQLSRTESPAPDSLLKKVSESLVVPPEPRDFEPPASFGDASQKQPKDNES